MSKPLALVIEDTKDQAILFSQALEWAGYETEVANDGLEGRKRLAEKVPHLVLLKPIDMMQLRDLAARLLGSG
jgi:CheY-like chemotaxis protein